MTLSSFSGLAGASGTSGTSGVGSTGYPTSETPISLTLAVPPSSSYTAFASQACTSLLITNYTFEPVEVRRVGQSVAVIVPCNTEYTMFGITDANQIEAKVLWDTYNIAASQPTGLVSNTTILKAIAITGGNSYSGTITTISASPTGANVVAFGSQACSMLLLSNGTGQDILWRIGAGGVTKLLAVNDNILITAAAGVALTNANQIQVGFAKAMSALITQSIRAEAFN